MRTRSTAAQWLMVCAMGTLWACDATTSATSDGGGMGQDAALAGLDGPDNADAVYTTCAIGVEGELSSCTRAHTSPPMAGGGNDMLIVGEHAFIALHEGDGDSLLRCAFAIDGLLTDCATITPASPGEIENPSGLAMFAGRLYITNAVDDFPLDSGYTHCALDALGELSDCVRDNPEDGSLFAVPYSMAFINDRAYVVNGISPGSYTRCDVGADGSLIDCVAAELPLADAPWSLAVYQP